MKEYGPQESATRDLPARRRHLLPWLLAGGCLLAILAAFLFPPVPETSSSRDSNQTNDIMAIRTRSAEKTRVSHRRGSSDAAPTAEEIVSRKLTQFGKSRRDLVHALAKHFKVDVPDDVERFFEAVEGGRWEEIAAAHKALLLGSDLNTPRSSELHRIWRAIQETWGAAKEAHNWPPQKLLDYGEAVLGSLRPGMIYVGGTDPGCFIPTFLNETTEGEHHIVLTQNALADGTYLEHLDFLYADHLATLTQEDSQHAFQSYLADAQKRLLHDQQFPGEPKQIRPGEDVKMAENRVQVSGQVAVMAINEKLLQTLMDKNPDASFAIEQSFPFESMYPNTTPLGPIMELRVQNEQNALTRERAAASIDYWRTTAQQFASDPETADSAAARQAWSKMASDQAALFLSHKYTAEAEQGFQVATELYPSSPEAVFRYVNLLLQQNRLNEAAQVAENGAKAAPDNAQFRDLVERLRTFKKN